MQSTSDERDAPSNDELDMHGRHLLYEMLLNDRRPVAIVGSGMSVVYGGVSWEASVRLGLNYAIRRIADLQKNGRKKDEATISSLKGKLADLARDRVALEAFARDDDALKSPNHKYVALDLCESALNRVDALGDLSNCPIVSDRRDGISSFRAFMAKVYRDDTFYITDLLAQRFNVDTGTNASPSEAKIWKDLQTLTPQEVQQLASTIYSKGFIAKNIRNSDTELHKLFLQFLDDLAGPLATMGFANFEALPIDRRSSLTIFLATLPKAEKNAQLASAIDAIMTERSAVGRKGRRGLAGESISEQDGRVDGCGNHEVRSDAIANLQRNLSPPRPILDPIARLREWLRVKRYMTLNFDYVLEKKLMLEDFRSTEPPPYGIDQAVKNGDLIKDGDTGGMTRRFPDGQMASTDVYHDKAVGRMFEFAMDSADYRAQILHLHGRADRPGSMLLTDGDSNRQYRRDRSSRTSLEQALDVTLTGNPILFVGIGLSEAEITRALRELVSRGHATPHNPVFAIMAIEKGGTTGWRDQMAQYRQYGIHLIHAGMPGYWKGLPFFLDVIKRLKGRLKETDWTKKFELKDWPALDPLPDNPAVPRQPIPRFGIDNNDEADARWPNGMAGDRKILAYIVDKTSRSTHPLAETIVKAWTDYLDMFKSKLLTFATIEAMRELYEGSIEYAQNRRLPSSRTRFDDYVDQQLKIDAEGSDEILPRDRDYGLIVRDAVLWRQSADCLANPANNVPERGWRHKPVRVEWATAATSNEIAITASLREDDPVMESACDRLLAGGSLMGGSGSAKPYATFFSPLGTGKGRLLRILSDQLNDGHATPHLIVNCNFAIEFDSVLSMVLAFVWQFHPDGKSTPPRWNRIDELRKCLKSFDNNLSWLQRGISPVIVLAGLERLIDRRQRSVAPELDLLLSELLSKNFETSKFQLIIIGADGCSRYIQEKFFRSDLVSNPWHGGNEAPEENTKRSAEVAKLCTEVVWNDVANDDQDELIKRGFLGHLYVKAWKRAAGRINTIELRDQLNYASRRSLEAMQPNSARSRAIEAMMRVVLDNWHDLAFDPPGNAQPERDVALNRLRASLDLRMLEAMSFIGLPIESHSLDHLNTPGGLLDKIIRMQKIPDADFTVEDERGIERAERCKAIARLAEFGFVVTIAPYPDKKSIETQIPAQTQTLAPVTVPSSISPKSAPLRTSTRTPAPVLATTPATAMRSEQEEATAVDLPDQETVNANDLRIVLHRCAMAELRERIGVRSGDELLSNSFSMTLAISMPTDLTVASEDIQQRMKETVGRFRGAWRDTLLDEAPGSPELTKLLGKLRSALNPGNKLSKFDLSMIRSEAQMVRLERAAKMMATDIQVTIRAAAGVIRGFFSAASIVAQMPTKTVLADGELGEFEEHRRRLGHVVSRFRESQRAFATAIQVLEEIRQGLPSAHEAHKLISDLDTEFKRLRARAKEIRRSPSDHPALYSGELVWLLNERSVISLLQGDLYEAQRGFREAEQANRVLRTNGLGQAWRRIEINRALVRIERGHIAEARTKLLQIQEMKKTASTDDVLTAPLVQSYLGLCDHLGGNYKMAEINFRRAIAGLIATDQQRALAVTYVRQAALFYGLRRYDEGDKVAQLGRATAEAGRQVDIQWRARMTEVRGMDAKADSATIVALFEDAIQYAKVMELPRVLIQAQRGLAEHQVDLGDYETAGVYAAEATTVAVRYGMVLQRIALRVLLGRILLYKNDESGHYLLRRAIAHADRVGYQQQVDRAQEAIIEASANRRY